MGATATALGAALTVLLAPAQDLPLEWNAPTPPCPDAAQVEADVARLTRPADAASAGVRVRADLESPHDGVWRLDLRIHTARGESRHALEAESCTTLAEATALLVALALEPPRPAPEPAARERSPRPEADSGPAAQPSPPEAPSRARTRAAGRRTARRPPLQLPPRAVSVAARTAGVIGGGLQPTASGGAELALALRTRFVRIELAGRTWFPDRAQIAAVPGAETLAQLALAEARVCPYGWVRRVELGGCAGWAAGGVIVATRGVRRPDRAAAFASTLSLGPMLAWHMHRRLALWVEPALVVALYRPRFVVDGIGEVWRMGPAAGQVALGLEVALGPTIIE